MLDKLTKVYNKDVASIIVEYAGVANIDIGKGIDYDYMVNLMDKRCLRLHKKYIRQQTEGKKLKLLDLAMKNDNKPFIDYYFTHLRCVSIFWLMDRNPDGVDYIFSNLIPPRQRAIRMGAIYAVIDSNDLLIARQECLTVMIKALTKLDPSLMEPYRHYDYGKNTLIANRLS